MRTFFLVAGSFESVSVIAPSHLVVLMARCLSSTY